MADQQNFVDITEDHESTENTTEPNETPSNTASEDDTGSKSLAVLAAVGLFSVLGLILVVEWKGKP